MIGLVAPGLVRGPSFLGPNIKARDLQRIGSICQKSVKLFSDPCGTRLRRLGLRAQVGSAAI